MMAKYLALKAVECKLISQDEGEMYGLAFSTLLFSFITWGTLLVLGLVQNCLLGCIVFIAAYLPLRVFSGGFHLSTKPRCYCFSLAVFVALLSIYSTELYTNTLYLICLLLAFPIIFFMAPQEDKNKPLCPVERSRNKKIVCFILIAEGAALAGIYFARITVTFYFMSFAQILMAFQLVLGKLRNTMLEKYIK